MKNQVAAYQSEERLYDPKARVIVGLDSLRGEENPLSDNSNGAAGNVAGRDYTWLIFIGVGLLVLLVQIGAGFGIYIAGFYFGGDEWALRGQFGDMFGAVNALFSGFAFAGVIIAVILQRNELALQRRELAASVKAQQGSSESLAEQVGMLERSSRLSAISTLVSAYGRELTVIDQSDQPIQENLSNLRSELTRNQDLLERANLTGTFFDVQEYQSAISTISSEIESFETRANENQSRREEAREKHERLIAELEGVVAEVEEAKRVAEFGRWVREDH